MTSINRVCLSGNLTKDPLLAHTPGGAAVCTLRLAVNGREKVGDQWRDRTEYVTITVWGNTGEACANHLSKGSPVAIDGKLRLEEWEKDGSKRSELKVVADNVQFLPSKRDGGGGQRSSEAIPDAEFKVPGADFNDPDSDIPFAFLDTYRDDVIASAYACKTRSSAKLHVW